MDKGELVAHCLYLATEKLSLYHCHSLFLALASKRKEEVLVICLSDVNQTHGLVRRDTF